MPERDSEQRAEEALKNLRSDVRMLRRLGLIKHAERDELLAAIDRAVKLARLAGRVEQAEKACAVTRRRLQACLHGDREGHRRSCRAGSLSDLDIMHKRLRAEVEAE